MLIVYKEFEKLRLVQHEDFKGFYIIPDVKEFIISKDGVVLNLMFHGREVSTAVSNHWYRRVGARTHLKSFRWKHHELMARAFVPRPLKLAKIPYERLRILHLDGIYSNNTVDNLRWITQFEYDELDVKAIYRNNPYYSDMPLAVMNLRTKAVIIYKDYYEACEAYGIHIEDMANALYNDKSYKHKNFLIREL